MKQSPHTLLPLIRHIAYIIVICSMAIAVCVGIISDNTEMILYALATILLLAIPWITDRYAHIQIPPFLELICILFLFASVTLAKLLDFYTLIPAWDLILHGISGPLLTAIGISLLGLWKFNGHGTSVLPPLCIVLFGFFFATTAAALWEFYEFAFDALVGTQMQKFEYYRGILDTGLFDTMSDMLIATAGAAAYALLTWIDLRFLKGKITTQLYLKKK